MPQKQQVPFAEPLWLSRTISPYYNDSHRRLQQEVRAYVDECILPFSEEWEQQGFVPAEVCRHFQVYAIGEVATEYPRMDWLI